MKIEKAKSGAKYFLKYFLLVTEAGLLLLNEKMQAAERIRFEGTDEQKARRFLDVSSGSLTDEDISKLRAILSSVDSVSTEESLVGPLTRAEIKSQGATQEEQRKLSSSRIELMVSSGLAENAEQAEDAVRKLSLYISTLRIREMSSKPDLQAMESVQALDEIDKTANTVSSRVREWYGLHFPELNSMVDDNISFVKLVSKFKWRQNFSDESELEELGYSKNKSRVLVSAAKESRGADLRDEDLERIVQLAEEAQHLFSLRDKLASHVEKTMRQAAPNVSAIAGATIGARLIARAGGLQRLSILPASTIQILGAEKALYRALKTGSRPPKHGILFQHAAVHSAPKWQRGKIARTVAGKIAIAARVDQFRGTKDEAVEKSLDGRLDEIKTKYAEAPKPRAQPVRRDGRPEQRRGEKPRRREGRHGFKPGRRDERRRS